ncbi:MAG TPA: DUF1573 domain-containing protein [Chitinophagales bacterium]|nr:DUF1573 domain-containing protein [Chitinophagales bacterium]
MKNLLLFVAAIAMVFTMQAQTSETPAVKTENIAPDSNEPKPVMTFETETIDYGTILRYADGVREFKFKNTGNAPLIINNCAGTCGCTVPSCPKEPIQPGETGSIQVKYATDRVGQFNKGVKIYSNASPADQPITVYIKGNVLNEEDPSHKSDPAQTDPHAGHNH